MGKTIKMFSLSTCIYCKKAKQLLQQLGAEFSFIDVDTLPGKERKSVMDEVLKYNPNRSFPTIIIGDEVIVGFQEDKIRRALGK